MSKAPVYVLIQQRVSLQTEWASKAVPLFLLSQLERDSICYKRKTIDVICVSVNTHKVCVCMSLGCSVIMHVCVFLQIQYIHICGVCVLNSNERERSELYLAVEKDTLEQMPTKYDRKHMALSAVIKLGFAQYTHINTRAQINTRTGKENVNQTDILDLCAEVYTMLVIKSLFC